MGSNNFGWVRFKKHTSQKREKIGTRDINVEVIIESLELKLWDIRDYLRSECR